MVVAAFFGTGEDKNHIVGGGGGGIDVTEVVGLVIVDQILLCGIFISKIDGGELGEFDFLLSLREVFHVEFQVPFYGVTIFV